MKTRSSRLKLVRPGMGEKVYESLFSKASKERLNELIHEAKETYVGESRNPFFGHALFAAQVIEAGEFICLYYGKRMPKAESTALIEAGYSQDYMLYVTCDVVIDGFGVGHGAAMANHSCMPNSTIEREYLPGFDHAPVAFLRADKRIEAGNEIETEYGFWDPENDPMPDLSNLSLYVPCKCLRPNCRRVLRLIE